MQFNVSAASIRNPIPAVLLFIMLTAVGLMSFRAMKIQQFPDIDLPIRPERVLLGVGRADEQVDDATRAAGAGHDPVPGVTAVQVEPFRAERPEVRPPIGRHLVLPDHLFPEGEAPELTRARVAYFAPSRPRFVGR